MSNSHRKRPLVLTVPLSAENVAAVFDQCVYKGVVATRSDYLIVKVFECRDRIAFSRSAAERSRVDILEMLMGVSDAIYATGLRVQTMLYDKAGRRWTEDFDLVEKLVVLGVVAGHIEMVHPQMTGNDWPYLQPLAKELIMGAGQ